MSKSLPVVWKSLVQEGGTPGTMKVSFLVEADWARIEKGEATPHEIIRIVQATMVAMTDLLAPDGEFKKEGGFNL